MSNLNKEKIEVAGATVDFYKYIQDGATCKFKHHKQPNLSS